MNKKLTMIGLIPWKTYVVGFHLSKFGCCKPTNLPTKLYPVFFLWSLAQALCGGTRAAMEMQKKTK